MDAREAQLWLETKLKERQLVEAEKKLQGKVERSPISELQWRKLVALQGCRFGMNREARNFVADLRGKGQEAVITRNQSEYIEALWHRYRNQHKYKLPEPQSEIMRFIYDLPIQSYECNPENDKFTITFQDGDLW